MAEIKTGARIFPAPAVPFVSGRIAIDQLSQGAYGIEVGDIDAAGGVFKAPLTDTTRSNMAMRPFLACPVSATEIIQCSVSGHHTERHGIGFAPVKRSPGSSYPSKSSAAVVSSSPVSSSPSSAKSAKSSSALPPPPPRGSSSRTFWTVSKEKLTPLPPVGWVQA